MEREQAEREFYEKCLTPELDSWTESAIEQYAKDYSSVESLLLIQSKRFLKALAKVQEYKEIKISAVTFSMLWTSLAAETPTMLIEAYDGLPFLTDPVLSEKFKAPWLFPGWKKLLDSIRDRCGDLALGSYIRYPQIKGKGVEAARNMLVSYTMMLKAHLRELPQSEEWKGVKKADVFFVSAGEYMEKQLPVLGIRPELDITYLEKGEEARFAAFRDCRYQGHTFTGLNLTDTVFEHCVFQKVTFDACALTDSRFISCTFEDCRFAQLSLMGAEFLSCRITDTVFSRVWSERGQSQKPEDCISCGETRFLSCLLEEVFFEDSKLEAVMAADCQFIGNRSAGSSLSGELKVQGSEES